MVVAEPDIRWEELEKQFDSGGNFDGGGDNDNGDEGGGGGPDDGRDDEKKSNAIVKGCLAGVIFGTLAGVAASTVYDEIMPDRYISRNHIMTSPDTKPGIELSVYGNAVNSTAEMGIIFAPMLALAAIGTLIGKKIESRFMRG
jgi:hypothetical protein